MNPKKEKSGFTGFKKFMAVFLAVQVVVICCGLIYLWQALRSYESSMPVHAAEYALELFENRRFEAIRDKSGFAPTAHVSEEDFDAYLGQKLDAAGELELKKYRSGEQEAIYLVKAGEDTLAKVVLEKKQESDAFGNTGWKIAKLQDVFAMQQPCVVLAPEFAVLSANGEPVSEDFRTLQQTQYYAGLPEGMETPIQACYTLEGFLTAPELTAQAPGVQECVIRETEQPNVYEVKALLSEEQAAEVQELAVEAAKVYARFISEDASFKQVAKYLVRESDFYNSLKTFYNGWYADHTSYEFENMQTEEFTAYSPDHISCKVSFTYVINSGGRHEYPSAYEIFMVRTEDGWRVASMDVL